MKNKKVKSKLRIDWSYIFLGLLAFICLFANVNFKFSLAEEASIEYTGVLTDLQKDKNFAIEDYPFIENDYSLQVIQIAESSNDELFIYVYQPCKEKVLTASYVNMAGSTLTYSSPDGGYSVYSLFLVDANGTLFKYKVGDYRVRHVSTRVYNIASIHRPFEEGIDTPVEGDNTISNVVYPVSKTWYATTYKNKVIYQVFDVETIQVTSKFVGFVRYTDGYYWHLWGESACDRHFLAFNTDKNIDKLVEADVYYSSRSAHFRRYLSLSYVDSWSYGDIEANKAHLTYSQKGEYDNGRDKYTWDRIQKMDDFIDEVNVSSVFPCLNFLNKNESKISDEQLAILKEQKWVLSFHETSYDISKSLHEENYYSTQVGDVSILRLMFESDGIVYDLGCVDNMQTGSDKPINTISTRKPRWWLIILLAVVIGLIIAFPSILITLFNVLFTIFKYIFKALWWLITAPLSWFDKEE